MSVRGVSEDEATILPTDLVRWLSIALSLLFLIVARPRSRPFERVTPTVRASRPLDAVTGPLWVALNVLSLVAFLSEAVVPGWIYEGPLTLRLIELLPLQVVGLTAWFLGGGLHWWAGRELGRHNLLQIEVRQSHRLITSGPYSRIRHPLYTGVLLMNAGVALFLLNAVLLALLPLTYLVAYRRALLEEEVLTSKEGFGEVYREYVARTGRFLPRLRVRPDPPRHD